MPEPRPDHYPTGWAKAEARIGLRVDNVGGDAGIDTDASYLRLDGQPLETWYDQGYLNAYPPPMSGGTHDASAVLVDNAGKEQLVFWTFEVDAVPPWIERGQESPTGTITDRTPLISVPASDADSGIPAEAGVVQIARRSNLQVVSGVFFGTYDEQTGLVSYQVPEVPTGPALGAGPLPDGTYDVLVSVNDRAGHTQLITWSFTVSTLPFEVPLGY